MPCIKACSPSGEASLPRRSELLISASCGLIPMVLRTGGDSPAEISLRDAEVAIRSRRHPKWPVSADQGGQVGAQPLAGLFDMTHRWRETVGTRPNFFGCPVGLSWVAIVRSEKKQRLVRTRKKNSDDISKVIVLVAVCNRGVQQWLRLTQSFPDSYPLPVPVLAPTPISRAPGRSALRYDPQAA
jgi:hypothetical protein